MSTVPVVNTVVPSVSATVQFDSHAFVTSDSASSTALSPISKRAKEERKTLPAPEIKGERRLRQPPLRLHPLRQPVLPPLWLKPTESWPTLWPLATRLGLPILKLLPRPRSGNTSSVFRRTQLLGIDLRLPVRVCLWFSANKTLIAHLAW